MKKKNKTRKLDDEDIALICSLYGTIDTEELVKMFNVHVNTIYYHVNNLLKKKDKRKLSDIRSKAGLEGARKRWGI